MALIEFDAALPSRLEALAAALLARRWRLAAAESCTGGLVAACCTSLAGSSDWFEAGWVTYSNAAKTSALGVPVETLAAHGAVSAEVVEAMARGAIARSGAQLAVAISGVAGPGGGSPDKPVGTVWIAIAWTEADDAVRVEAERLRLDGDRHAVRVRTVDHVLHRLTRAAVRGHGRRE